MANMTSTKKKTLLMKLAAAAPKMAPGVGRSPGHQRRQPEERLEGQGEQGVDGNRQRLGGPQHQDAGEKRGQPVRLRGQPFGRREDQDEAGQRRRAEQAGGGDAGAGAARARRGAVRCRGARSAAGRGRTVRGHDCSSISFRSSRAMVIAVRAAGAPQ